MTAEDSSQPTFESSTFDNMLRSLRLQILHGLKSPMNKTEKRKTALHSSHRTAAVYGLLHLLPLATCVVLVTLNFKTLLIGTISTEGLTAFQFASKLLEVLIQASITAIVLAFVRKAVLGPSPLPFGGLIAPFRITDFSLLWSLELWGFFTSPNARNRIAMCMIFLAAVILAGIIGPSTAVLMIPRPITCPAESQLLLMTPDDMLYPVNIALDNGAMISEAEYNSSSRSVSSTFEAWSRMPIADSSGTRDMWFVPNSSDGNWTAIASIPSTLSSNVLSVFDEGYDAVIVRAAQPYVYTNCWCPETEDTSLFTPGQWLDFGPTKPYLRNSIPYTWLLPNSSAVSNNDSFTILPTIQDDAWYADPGISGLITTVFSRPPTAVSNHSLLVGWAASNTTNTSQVLGACACTIDASWAVTSTSQRPQTPSNEETSSSSINIKDPDSIFSGLKNPKTIYLSPEWARRAFTLAPTSFLGAAKFVISPVISLALSYVPQIPDLSDLQEYETFPTFADDASTDQNSTDLTDQQYTDVLKLIGDNHLFDQYGEVSLLPVAGNWTEPAKLAQFGIYTFYEGYGYSTATTTVRLSLAVVMFYMVMATAYLIYSVTGGMAASSWDSIAELVALALNSEKPQALHNTSAGISTLETYRQLVNIRVNAEDSLEIVFDAEQQFGQYKLVEMNEQY